MKRIPTLDGWRAVAILMVMVYHVFLHFDLDQFRLGARGVDIFFAISGLLITSRLLAERDRSGSISLRAFYTRRAFRILPTSLLFLSVIGALGLFASRLDAISCLTFWRNYLYGLLHTRYHVYTNHLWSLSIEEQFYLVWPWVLIRTGPNARKWLFRAILAVVVWRIGVWMLVGPVSYFRTEMRADGLLWGCLVAYFFRERKLDVSRILFVVSALALTLLTSVPGAFALIPVCCAALVLGTAQNPTWTVSRILGWQPLVWIGQRSYGLYVWQQIFIFDFPGFHLPLALRLVLLFLLAELSYRYFEVPLQRIGAKLAEALRASDGHDEGRGTETDLVRDQVPSPN